MAYIRQVGSKFKVEIRVKSGDRTLAENFTRDTRAEAERDARLREDELLAQKNGGFPRKTVRDLLRRWRDEVAPLRDGARWDIGRLGAIERRMDEMGLVDMQLGEFRSKQMAAVRRSRLAEIAAPSVSREEALLKAVWSKARHPDWAWTDVDPFLDLGPIKGSKGRARNRKARWPELKRILRQLGYHPRRAQTTKTSEVGLALMLALRTTLRSQEVLQLGDDCVDLGRMVITVPQHKTRYITNEPKRVPAMPKAVVLLARKCLGRARYFTLQSASRDSLYRKAKKLAGVPDLTFHDMKRTSVIMLKSQLSDDELMAVTGNADIAVLRRHYMTDTAAEASKAVWRALGVDPAMLLKTVGAAPRAEALSSRT